MATAWFICPYKRVIPTSGPFLAQRYCAMNDFNSIIRADGGLWHETEVLGNHAIVKVRAEIATLQTINAEPGFIRLPKDRLDDSLSDLSSAAKKIIRGTILSLGYTIQEINEHIGNDIGSKTLRDVLKFIARRRLKPRYDADADEIVLDGAEQPVRPLEDVDGAVLE